MNITETISLLDELRGKVKENNHAENWDTDETFGGDAVIVKRHEFETGMKGTEVLFEGDWGEAEDAAYIVALHNNYEALRQAALDGERYRKEAEAGRKLAESLDKLEDFSVEHWQRAVKKRLTAYRQAVEQKEV